MWLKVPIASVNMVDVNVAIMKRKATNVHALKKWEPRKNKSIVDWVELWKSFVNTIQ
jgi:hypothetical protein